MAWGSIRYNRNWEKHGAHRMGANDPDAAILYPKKAMPEQLLINGGR
jgi:hypothetical protein